MRSSEWSSDVSSSDLRASGALGLGEAASQGRAAAWNALNRTNSGDTSQSPGNNGAPAWARAMRSQQTARHHRQIAMHTLQQGDRGGASATPDTKERDSSLIFNRAVQRSATASNAAWRKQ